jgi:hypothetical protein
MPMFCRRKRQAEPEGIEVAKLPEGTVLQVETGNRTYFIEKTDSQQVLISGHPEHCPEPVLADLCGDGAVEGCCLQYLHPKRGIIRTSRIRKVRTLAR